MRSSTNGHAPYDPHRPGVGRHQASNLLDLEGPITSGELARRLRLTTGATTRVVDRLVKAGLARRQDDPADRRRALVAHTGHRPAGLDEILARVREPIQEALQDFSTEQLAGVQRYLEVATRAYADGARTLS
ncbi:MULTISPECIES: MarR family transcriptional regulator [unclassified Mycobacterium]|uniref:MarR family winged helix-turn-helix transcriptional regulator n=1 Tax=unclassified Mycobacterium TaxID=2642494 RepID=UPI0009EC9E30